MQKLVVVVLASLGCRGTTAGIAHDTSGMSRLQACDRDQAACGSGTMSGAEALAIGLTGLVVLVGGTALHRLWK